MATPSEAGRERLRHFFVYSPEYETPAYGMNPPEWGSDVVQVEAASKRDALLLGVKEMERKCMRWVRNNRWDGKPPWAGIKVEKVPVEPMGHRVNAVPREFWPVRS
jgi:hypothetical protein